MSTTIPMNAPMHEPIIVPRGTCELVEEVAASPRDEPEGVDEEEVERLIRLRFERSYHTRGALQQLQAILATGSIVKFDKKIKQPTIIIHGEKDGLVPSAHGRAIAKAIAHSEFHLIKDMGHDLAKPFIPTIVKLLADHYVKHA